MSDRRTLIILLGICLLTARVEILFVMFSAYTYLSISLSFNICQLVSVKSKEKKKK